MPDAIKVADVASVHRFKKMSRDVGHHDRPGRPFSFSYIATLLFIILTLSMSTTLRSATAGPVPDLVQEYQNLVSEASTIDNSTENSTEISANTDVYVIKAMVYEIGILTDADNTTNESTERHKRVDISMYDPPYKEDEFS